MCMVQHYFPSVNFHHIVALEDSGKFPIRVQRTSVVDHWKNKLTKWLKRNVIARDQVSQSGEKEKKRGESEK